MYSMYSMFTFNVFLFLAASGCFWLLLVASGCFWLPLAAAAVSASVAAAAAGTGAGGGAAAAGDGAGDAAGDGAGAGAGAGDVLVLLLVLVLVLVPSPPHPEHLGVFKWSKIMCERNGSNFCTLCFFVCLIFLCRFFRALSLCLSCLTFAPNLFQKIRHDTFGQ